MLAQRAVKVTVRTIACSSLILAGPIAIPATAIAQELDAIPHSAGLAQRNEFFATHNAALSMCPRLVLEKGEIDPADFGFEEAAALMAPGMDTPPDRYFTANYDTHTVRVHFDPSAATCETAVSWTGSSRLPTMRSVRLAIKREGYYRLSHEAEVSLYERPAPEGEGYWYYRISTSSKAFAVRFRAIR